MANSKYQKTEKGRVIHNKASSKYNKSTKGKIVVKKAQDKFRKSTHGKKARKGYRESDAGKIAQRKYEYKTLYGITLEEYESMFTSQNGRCFICRRTQEIALAVDHDHTTGNVRGLLCSGCNMRLGWYERYLHIVDLYLKGLGEDL